ncbi:MAG: glycosyltransferase family 4 protein, partial [Nitrospinota bacterium]
MSGSDPTDLRPSQPTTGDPVSDGRTSPHGPGDGLIDICHIITRLDRGGSSDNTLFTVLSLQGKGFRFCVLKGPGEPGEPPSPLEERTRERGIEVVLLPHLIRPVCAPADFRALGEIHRFLKSRRFDIVHTHSSKAGLLGRIAARRARVPSVVHTPHGHIFYGYFGPLRSRLYLGLERWAVRRTDRIIALTERGRREHLALGVGRPEQYRVIPSGIPLDDFYPDPQRRRRTRERLGIPEGVPAVGTVGRLTTVKDQKTLLDAADRLRSRFPNLAVFLIGDGELRGPLESQARRLGLQDTVRFLGWRSDVPDLMNALDLFVLCSRNEGMGRALVEAMASGLPAVATDVGGLPDLIRSGVNGRLIPVVDAA